MEKAKRITNVEFAQKDKPFVKACKKVALMTDKEFSQTARQASRWRRKTGLAYKTMNEKERKM